METEIPIFVGRIRGITNGRAITAAYNNPENV